MRTNTIMFGVGTCLTISGMTMLFLWGNIFEGQLQKKLVLQEDSLVYNIWRQTPQDIPIYISIYMFNITNVQSILSGYGDIKPKLQQIGPYVFREIVTKENVTWHPNGTVSYYNRKQWMFIPERTNGSLCDMITSVNPTITYIANKVRDESFFARMSVDLGLNLFHSNQFLTANVSSWLFEGIQDPIIEAMYTFPFVLLDLPKRIGWFYGRNNSKDFEGEYLMNTGTEDYSKIGLIEKWRHSNRTAYPNECSRVGGSGGEFWKMLPEQRKIEFFAPDICTSLVLQKKSEIKLDGVDALLFTSDHTLFDNGRSNYRMACYCNEGVDCLPDGVLNASLCYNGAPVFVSSPHFYGAHQFYSSKVDGLDTNPTDEYAFQLAVDPLTGMTLIVKAHVQMNLLIRKVPNILINNKLPEDTVLPVFWTRQEMAVTANHMKMIKYASHVRYGVPYALGVIIVFGAILLCLSVLISARNKMVVSESKQVLEENASYTYFADKY